MAVKEESTWRPYLFKSQRMYRRGKQILNVSCYRNEEKDEN